MVTAWVGVAGTEAVGEPGDTGEIDPGTTVPAAADTSFPARDSGVEEGTGAGTTGASPSTRTVRPGQAMRRRSSAFQLASRKHPWLSVRPTSSGLGVPWIPYPERLSPIQATPTGLLGPGGMRSLRPTVRDSGDSGNTSGSQV